MHRGGWRLTPVGRFSDKVRNFEDMVAVAIRDGELAGAERSTLVEFARSLRLTREQVNGILSEARCTLRLRANARNCSACGECQTPEAKFCGACGTRLDP